MKTFCIINNFQKGNIYDIKVVDLEPKLTFLGLNLDDALRLQKEHDEVIRQIQVINNNFICLF